jgi:hypothetical protein
VIATKDALRNLAPYGIKGEPPIRLGDERVPAKCVVPAGEGRVVRIGRAADSTSTLIRELPLLLVVDEESALGTGTV